MTIWKVIEYIPTAIVIMIVLCISIFYGSRIIYKIKKTYGVISKAFKSVFGAFIFREPVDHSENETSAPIHYQSKVYPRRIDLN
jgi:hypothetical protein